MSPDDPQYNTSGFTGCMRHWLGVRCAYDGGEGKDEEGEEEPEAEEEGDPIAARQDKEHSGFSPRRHHIQGPFLGTNITTTCKLMRLNILKKIIRR